MSQYYPVAVPQQAVPELASNAQDVFVRTIPLDSAMSDKEVIIKGNFIWVVDASDITATVSAKFNDQDGAGFPIRRGFSMAGVDFAKLYLTSPAQVGKYITLVTARELPGKLIRAINPDINRNEVDLVLGSTISSTAFAIVTATTTLVAAADSTRRGVTIHNDSSTHPLFIGPAGVDATDGLPIPPEGYAVYDRSPRAAFYCYQASGANVDVRVLEEFD